MLSLERWVGESGSDEVVARRLTWRRPASCGSRPLALALSAVHLRCAGTVDPNTATRRSRRPPVLAPPPRNPGHLSLPPPRPASSRAPPPRSGTTSFCQRTALRLPHRPRTLVDMAAPANLDDDDDHTRQLAPPPSYASLASPLVPQHAFRPQHTDLVHADSRPIHPAFDHAFGESLHLPRGCFLVRNAAQGKALDLLKHRVDEGAECVPSFTLARPRATQRAHPAPCARRIGLHPIKQPQLRGLSLQHSGSNQLFFLSWDGHLVSAAASREVDVQGACASSPTLLTSN